MSNVVPGTRPMLPSKHVFTTTPICGTWVLPKFNIVFLVVRLCLFYEDPISLLNLIVMTHC